MNDLFRVRLDFPDNPALDDEFLAQNGATYRWDGTVWVPIGSGRDVYLPLAGGTMEGTLVLDANPVNAMEAASKVYVDTVATGARLIIGVINGTNGQCQYTAASGLPSPSPLVNASTVPSGSDVICVIAGTIPPDPLLPVEVWNMRLEASDVLVSNGATWILIHVPRAPITAGQVLTIPAVFGAANVQDALTQAALQDMPPGGLTGQVLTKRVGADYDTEWTDVSDPVDYTNIFMNRTPGGSGAVDPNVFPIGSQSIWMNSGGIVNMPPTSPGNSPTGFWMVNTYRAGSTKLQQAIEHTNTSPGPSTILSLWMRPGGNIDTTWGPWVRQSISNSDGAFVRLIGDTMTGPLQIVVGGLTEQTQQALEIDGNLHLASQTGGNFRYVNRGNNQGGLTFVSNGVPTYVDWLIFNAVGNFVSLNSPGGTGTTIINGDATITGDLSATAGSFAGRVTAALAPTLNSHLANKGYVDQLFSAAPILVGVIDAGTGNCRFADGTVGAVPPPTGSRHYIICTTPGTIPGGPANGIVMRLGDELYDGLIAGVAGWILIAVGTGGIATTADQVALVPNVAGTNNVQAGLQVLNANKVEKAGDSLTGTLRWPTTVTSAPPNATGTSGGERVRIYDAAGASGMGIGVEPNNMWFNNAAAGNGYRFYLGANLAYTMNSTSFQLKQAGVGGISLHNGTATQCGYTEFFTQEGTRRGYIGFKGQGNTLLLQNETGWQWEIPGGLPSLNTTGTIQVNMAQGTIGLRLRKTSNTVGDVAPNIRFETSNGYMLGGLRARQMGGAGYYSTYDSQVQCFAGAGGYGEQQAWWTAQQSGGFMSFRVQGDVFARNVQLVSDASLKTNIAPLDISAAAKLFDGIIPKQFHWKPVKVKTKLGGEMPGVDDNPTSINLGFIANDIEKVAPQLVSKNDEGKSSYDLTAMVALLWAKVMEQDKEIKALKHG